jgi:hypothetical protein
MATSRTHTTLGRQGEQVGRRCDRERIGGVSLQSDPRVTGGSSDGAPRAATGTSDETFAGLRVELPRLSFHLAGHERAGLVGRRDRMIRLLDALRTRRDHPEAPLLVVVGGGTGAGKSTTVNTLAGDAVSSPGVLRPTTRVPTLVCHPDDAAWFAGDALFPDLVRVPVSAPLADETGRQLRTATSEQLPAGVALLDTPDIDSVEVANHELADRALDAADAWLWLATARTYADQVGMEHLVLAQARSAPTAVAITQLREDHRDAIEPDVARLLADSGIRPDRLLIVRFDRVEDGRLPSDAVADLRTWLTELASSPDGRRAIREQALAGLLAAAPAELHPLLAAAEAEAGAARRLDAVVRTRFAAIHERLERELDVGLPLRTEIVDRWQRLVGGNQALLQVQTAAGRLGDLVRRRLARTSAPDVEEVRVEVTSELTTTISLLLEQAHREVRRGLEERPDGRALLDLAPELRGEQPDPRPAVRAMVTGWEAHVTTLVSEVGTPGRVRAQRVSTGLNAVATSAILVLFTLSGGLTGGEVGIAAGAAAANQWLLTRLLGEQNLRRLMALVRDDLFDRVGTLADEERRRYDAAIAGASPPEEAVDALRRVVATTS